MLPLYARLFSSLLVFPFFSVTSQGKLPLVVNTWPVPEATEAAWDAINGGDSAVNSVVRGCTKCEELQCRGTVGFGGSPDETGETQDAMIMNGATYEVGGVGDLRRIKNAIGVAKAVMDYSEHSLLVGESAQKFAVEMGFKEESLTTNTSDQMWKDWEKNKCQPNFRKNVTPDPKQNCGPYKPLPVIGKGLCCDDFNIGPDNHDTIGMIAVDKHGSVASGTSTNGLKYKIAGRVGDSPFAGAGSYASNLGGAAAGTGNGDIMMRFLPSYQAVLEMENGTPPAQAAKKAVARMARFYPQLFGAVIAANTKGDFGAACHGYSNFTYCVRNPSMDKVQLFTVPCI